MEKKELQLELPENQDITHYSNLVIISFNEDEFILDFARVMPGNRNPRIVSRVVLNPRNAKRLAGLLSNNIVEYENKFGSIILPEFGKDAH
ncbi:MAG: DUF3467 domain-containing protein [Brevinematales bacterium]|nr:DUF3467 domain-containing protein [Brevinematales bacterium]